MKKTDISDASHQLPVPDNAKVTTGSGFSVLHHHHAGCTALVAGKNETLDHRCFVAGCFFVVMARGNDLRKKVKERQKARMISYLEMGF